jgi:hypothetical protein
MVVPQAMRQLSTRVAGSRDLPARARRLTARPQDPEEFEGEDEVILRSKNFGRERHRALGMVGIWGAGYFGGFVGPRNWYLSARMFCICTVALCTESYAQELDANLKTSVKGR